MKLVMLIIGLVIGFGGGVYWGVYHPAQAQGIAAEEEKKFLEAQLKASQTIKDKLNEVAAHHQVQTGNTATNSETASSGTGDAATSRDINSLQKQQDEQIQGLQKRLSGLQ